MSLSASSSSCTSIFASRKAELTEISGIPKIPASPLTFIGFLNSGSGRLTLHRGQSSILEADRKQPISWPQPVTQKYITAPQVCWQMTQVKTYLSLLTSLFDCILSLISRNILFISDKSPVWAYGGKKNKMYIRKSVSWSLLLCTECLKLCLASDWHITFSHTILLIFLNCICNSCTQELENVVMLSKAIL